MQFIAPEILDGVDEIILDDDESFHAIKVLRFKKGDLIKIFDGKAKYIGVIKGFVGKKVVVSDLKKVLTSKKRYKLNLYIPFIEKKDFEDIIRKATEIGVDAFFPLVTEYTQRRYILNDKEFERIKKIIISAVKQCERASIPLINKPVSLENLLKLSNKFICGMIEPDRVYTLKDVIRKNDSEINVIVGPEGGFSKREIELMGDNFFKIRLSSNILTTQTAALSLISCIMYHIENEDIF